MTPVTAPDWEEIRRAYDGGRGGTYAEIGRRFGLSANVVAKHAARGAWRRSHREADAIRRRIRQLAHDEPELSGPAVRLRLIAEFGERHPGIPAVRTIYDIKGGGGPRPGPLVPEPVRETLDGLTRTCYGCGQRTTRDPCQWCALASHEVTA